MMDLDSLKYADLRRLAKEVGLKANLKADKLREALKEHYNQKEKSVKELSESQCPTENDPVHNVQTDDQGDFVTKRRGKGQNAKRKHEDAVKLSPGLVQPSISESKPEEGERSAKRKKSSLQVDVVVVEAPVLEKLEKQVEITNDKVNPEISAQGKDKHQKRTTGRIPRAVGLLNKAKPVLKPTTPNFKKLHEAHFNKMESIDSYVQRKNKQIESYMNSVKELKNLSEKACLKVSVTKSSSKPEEGLTPRRSSGKRSSLFSPARPVKPAPSRIARSQQSFNKSSLKSSAVFKPTVISANKINVRFSQATKDNEHKRSLTKTPARMSPHVSLTSTPAKMSTAAKKTGANTSVSSIIKTPGSAPFVFGETRASNTPCSNKKSTFDLKASLSRPLSYKPHKGKLKPFGESQENTLNKSQNIPSHQKKYKQHQVQTRVERRIKHTDDRKQKKDKMLGARRGLIMT